MCSCMLLVWFATHDDLCISQPKDNDAIFSRLFFLEINIFTFIEILAQPLILPGLLSHHGQVIKLFRYVSGKIVVLTTHVFSRDTTHLP